MYYDKKNGHFRIWHVFISCFYIGIWEILLDSHQGLVKNIDNIIQKYYNIIEIFILGLFL